jgi:hypothetical protein
MLDYMLSVNIDLKNSEAVLLLLLLIANYCLEILTLTIIQILHYPRGYNQGYNHMEEILFTHSINKGSLIVI